jgi:hypothetical protein
MRCRRFISIKHCFSVPNSEWFFLVSELNDMVMCIEDGEQGAELVTWHRTGEEDQVGAMIRQALIG